MSDFLSVVGSVTVLDLAKAAKAGKLHLVKEYRTTAEGVAIKLHDAQAALVHLGRYHKLWVDKVEHGGEINVLTPEEVEAKRKARWESVKGALALAAQGEAVSGGDSKGAADPA